MNKDEQIIPNGSRKTIPLEPKLSEGLPYSELKPA